MGDLIKQLLNQITTIWKRLTSTQKIVLCSVIALTIGSFVILMVWVRQPNYVLLYSGLGLEDAGEIVEKLKEAKIPYRLTRNGTAIEVPSKQVYELRLQLAGQGLPKKAELGYEIFDKTNLGMSDFVQKLNYKRALEGELTRTIQQMAEIRQARVHIVLPEPTLFREDQKEATASIVLNLNPSIKLSQRQVQGIAHLVASSVEGLKPENITIIDSFGNILSDNTEKNTLVGLSASQLELKKNVESYLAGKVQSLLDGVLGPRNALVRVDAELDFKQVERTNEIYDPDKSSIRSEEIEAETSSTGTNNPNRREHTITNYEVNRTVEHIVERAGNIKRLSVAVLVNGTYSKRKNSEGKEEMQYVPRTPEQLNELTRVVKGAVGFDESRNDQLSVTNFAFDTSQLDQEREFFRQYEKKQFWKLLIQKAVIGISVLLVLLVVRSLIKKVESKMATAPTLLPARLEKDISLPEVPRTVIPEAKKLEQLQDRIVSYTKEKPEDTSRLLKSWLIEEH